MRRTAAVPLSPLNDAINEVVSSGLARKLHDQLLSKMKTHGCTSSMPKQRIVSAYLSDMTALDEQLVQFDEMCRALARNHIRFLELSDRLEMTGPQVGSVQQQAFETTLNKVVGAQRVIMGISVVTADLMAESQDYILLIVQRDVSRRVEVLVAHLVGSLINGMTSGLYGIAVWPGVSSTWYVRNDHLLKLASTKTTNTSFDRMTVNHRYEQWMRCNEVHLMDAVRLCGIPGWLEYPPNIQEALDKIAPLFKAHVSTIVGTMIRKREISWCVGAMNISEDILLPQPAPIYDPAIAIGPIVLTGWEKESHRIRRWWQGFRQTFAKKME